MAACEVYLRVMTWPLSALAVYDAGAALCRSIGKTWVIMYISAAANIVNIIGNCVGVFVLKSGTAGVGLSVHHLPATVHGGREYRQRQFLLQKD